MSTEIAKSFSFIFVRENYFHIGNRWIPGKAVLSGKTKPPAGQIPAGGFYYSHRSTIIWANSLADSIKSLTRTRSSAPWRWVSNPGRVQPKATPPGMSWT